MGDEEALLKIIFHREQVDDEGKLKPGAFSSQDLLDPTRRGVSVIRSAYSDPSDLERRGRAFETKPANEYLGVSHALTGNIRQIRHQSGQGRVFCVVDDGEENFASHTLVMLCEHFVANTAKAEPATKNLVQKQYRRELMDRFSILMSAAEYYAISDA